MCVCVCVYVERERERASERERERERVKSNYLLLHRYLHEYGHVRNRHIMFITIEHIKNIGISKFENT